jgi:hypothetical protein
MVQCREGWHLDQEPVIERAKPSEEQRTTGADGRPGDLVVAFVGAVTVTRSG